MSDDDYSHNEQEARTPGAATQGWGAAVDAVANHYVPRLVELFIPHHLFQIRPTGADQAGSVEASFGVATVRTQVWIARLFSIFSVRPTGGVTCAAGHCGK